MNKCHFSRIYMYISLMLFEYCRLHPHRVAAPLMTEGLNSSEAKLRVICIVYSRFCGHTQQHYTNSERNIFIDVYNIYTMAVGAIWACTLYAEKSGAHQSDYFVHELLRIK